MTRQGMGITVTSARDLGCVPRLVGHDPRVTPGSPFKARRRQLPHFTQSFNGIDNKTQRVFYAPPGAAV